MKRFLPFLLIAGCGTPDAPRAARPETPVAPWVSDGRVGVRVLDGGARMRVFRLDRYQTNGEEKILPEEQPMFPASAAGWTNWATRWPSGDVGAEAKGDRFLTLRVIDGVLVARMTQPGTGPSYQTWPSSAPGETLWNRPRPALPTITVEGDDEDQRRIDGLLGSLLAAVGPGTDRAVAPMALSSDVYFGHVFWDADIWVFPALALLSPERAAAIPKYRLKHAAQARENAKAWTAEGSPDATGRKRGVATGPSGIKYPWESSVSGRETTPGFSKHEEHITGSVAFGLRQAAWLGLASSGEVDRIVAEAGDHYAALAEDGGHIRGVVSVDESHTGDDDLYTNLLARWCANGGTWRRSGTRAYVLPRDGRSLLTYAGDPERGYKQAAAVLSVFPLQFPEAEKTAAILMDRFASKATRNGPAMTDSVHATIHARMGDPKTGYRAWVEAIDPFVKGPGLFSEKRSSDRTAFVTGAAGAMNTVLYGFAGLRLDDAPAPASAFPPVRLKAGGWLSCRPHLPPHWKRLVIDPLVLPSGRYRLTITGASATLVRKG